MGCRRDEVMPSCGNVDGTVITLGRGTGPQGSCAIAAI
jgi:hypothetical protein